MTSTNGPRPKPRRRKPAPTAAGVETPKHELRVRVGARRWRTLWPEAVATVERAARAALSGATRVYEVSVLLTDDRRMRVLNRDYRGIDKSTNVLAFASEDAAFVAATPETMPLILGDVVLALETIDREAAAQGKPPLEHLAHLTVHGVLHLRGHDHLDARQAKRMEAVEIGILAGLGIDNPYVARLA